MDVADDASDASDEELIVKAAGVEGGTEGDFCMDTTENVDDDVENDGVNIEDGTGVEF